MNDDLLLKVGIADMKVAKREQGIVTFALGSCIGVCLYDPVTKVAGMVHIMLAEPGRTSGVDNVAKYATTGVPELINQMVRAGASKSRLVAKIAGGAKMFNMSANSSIGDIGRKNTDTVKRVLNEQGIRLLASDCGLDYARTLTLYRESGEARVRSYAHPEKTL